MLFRSGDQILAGNSTIGLQYLQVKSTSIAGNTTANVSFVGNTQVNSNTHYITVASHPFTNGDVVVYANSAGNNELTGLSSGTSYYVIDAANTTSFRLSATPFGSVLNIAATAGSNGTFLANTRTLSIQFEDPYRLRAGYNSNTVQRYWEIGRAHV